MHSSITVRELRVIAKQKGIIGRWSMTKQELIDTLQCMETSEEIKGQAEETKVTQTTQDYLMNIDDGTIIAFKIKTRQGDIALSGKYQRLNSNGTVTVSTKQGTQFEVLFCDILWVKTGRRWPRWVFEMFHDVPTKAVE